MSYLLPIALIQSLVFVIIIFGISHFKDSWNIEYDSLWQTAVSLFSFFTLITLIGLTIASFILDKKVLDIL